MLGRSQLYTSTCVGIYSNSLSQNRPFFVIAHVLTAVVQGVDVVCIYFINHYKVFFKEILPRNNKLEICRLLVAL